MKLKKLISLFFIVLFLFSPKYSNSMNKASNTTSSSNNKTQKISTAAILGIAFGTAGVIATLTAAIIYLSKVKLPEHRVKSLKTKIADLLNAKDVIDAITNFDENKPKESIDNIFEAMKNNLPQELHEYLDSYKKSFVKEWNNKTLEKFKNNPGEVTTPAQDLAAQQASENQVKLDTLAETLQDFKFNSTSLFNALEKRYPKVDSSEFINLENQFKETVKEATTTNIPERVFLEKIINTTIRDASNAEDAAKNIFIESEKMNIDPVLATKSQSILTNSLLNKFVGIDNVKDQPIGRTIIDIPARLFSNVINLSLAKEIQEVAYSRFKWVLITKFLDENNQLKQEIKNLLLNNLDNLNTETIDTLFEKYNRELNVFITKNKEFINTEAAKSYVLGVIGEIIEKENPIKVEQGSTYQKEVEKRYKKILENSKNIKLEPQTIQTILENVKAISKDSTSYSSSPKEFFNKLLEGIDREELFNKFSDVLRDYGITEYKFDTFEPRGSEPRTRDPRTEPEPEPTREPGPREPYEMTDFLHEFEGF